MDNEVSVAAEDADPRGIVPIGRRIRIAGWDQVAHWTKGAPGSGTWPPDGQVISVMLSDAEWALVCSALTRWAGASEQVGDVGAAEASRRIRDLIVDQMRARIPGWGNRPQV
jgi:hypothetical protein